MAGSRGWPAKEVDGQEEVEEVDGEEEPEENVEYSDESPLPKNQGKLSCPQIHKMHLPKIQNLMNLQNL